MVELGKRREYNKNNKLNLLIIESVDSKVGLSEVFH